MNELALFAGAGGGLLGTKLLGWRPVCGVEIDPYCREAILRRQEEGHLEPFPLWDDVNTFDGLPWRGLVDVVTAGFPCQPFSDAGSKQAEKDPRNKWPETIQTIREVQPTYALLENVPGLARHAYFHKILGDLCEAGFNAKWAIISAADIGANHLRKRLWIVANSNRGLCERRKECDGNSKTPGKTQHRNNSQRLCNSISDANCERLEGRHGKNSQRQGPGQDRSTGSLVRTENEWWQTEPEVGRVVDGLAYRVDQLRAIGNGQVPGVVRAAWELLADV